MTKILVIDDNKDNLLTISVLLKNLISDCLVITALSGLEGIEQAKSELPNTILLDDKMPEMDGYEVCNRLKSDENTKHIPIIMLTAIKSDSESHVKGLEAGADTFLKKPIEEAELAAQINLTLRVNRAEKEKARLRGQLQQVQKMEALGILAGGIAHDFNNILFPIIGYTEMTMYDLPENSKARNNLQLVLKATNRAKNLVQQILTFRRQSDQERKPLKIQYIIKETLKLLRASLPSTIEIRQSIDNACGPVLVDPYKIQQILMNLCTNTYHAMGQKGGVLEVTLSEVDIDSGDLFSKIDLSPGSYLKLTVSDTGQGIKNSDMERIFATYSTINGQNEGIGMSLAIVRDIVQSYQGDISVYSDPDKGTSAKIYLPLIDTNADEMPTISTEQYVSKGNESILIVDDEDDVAQMMQSMLERLGYQVSSKTSSIEALEIFRTQPEKFDIVITDQTMPQMTGVELAKELMLIRPDIPVILCTGFSEMIAENNAKSLGIEAYAVKPIRLKEVAELIRKVLDRN